MLCLQIWLHSHAAESLQRMTSALMQLLLVCLRLDHYVHYVKRVWAAIEHC